MKLLNQKLAVLCAGVLLAAPAFAQRPGGGSPGIDPSFLQAMGNRSFSAKALMTTDGPAKTSVTMAMAVLDGDTRTDIDMMAVAGANMPPAALAQMKTMGMDQVVTIVRPRQKTQTMIYPGLKGYVETPIPDAPAPPAGAATGATPTTTEVGRETLDGHPTIKSKMTTDAGGKKRDVLLWQATDMGNFPIQAQTVADGTTVTLHFTDVKLEKPAASLFAPPAGFKKYTTMQEMMMARMTAPRK